MYNRLCRVLEKHQKRRVNYILNKKIKYYTKESFQFLGILVFGLIAITLLIFIKYKPVYKVTLSGETIGSVKNKEQIENAMNEYLNQKDEQIAFITLKQKPEFQLTFVENSIKTNEENVLLAIKDSTIITYKMYAITLANKQKAVVSTLEEAQKVIEEIKAEFNQDLELDLKVSEIYDDEKITVESVETAIASINNDSIIKEKLSSTVNGITLSKPVSGTITSRYGRRSSGYHTGLDIANKTGTPIKPVAKGTVTFAGWKGSYGNLVIVSHGKGVETYYAHCSKIYASKGQEVSTNDTISLVGSTGNSTGPHLHLELRVNGQTVNPQKYIYK